MHCEQSLAAKVTNGDKYDANFRLVHYPSALFQGVVINYREPPEARQPRTRWRLYPFKGDETLRKFGQIVVDDSACMYRWVWLVSLSLSLSATLPPLPPFLSPHLYSNPLHSPPECLPHWQRQTGRWVTSETESGHGTDLFVVHVHPGETGKETNQ